MDDLYKMYRLYGLLHSLLEDRQNVKDEKVSKAPSFDPEQVIAHCFKPLKWKDFRLPQSRRRIIVLPGTQDQAPPDPIVPPQPPPPPIPSYKTLEIKDIQEQPVDRRIWLSQRAKLRQELESFGDVRRWLENKYSLTPSEAKVLLVLRQDQKTLLKRSRISKVKSPKIRSSRIPCKLLPQLRLPKPSSLATLFSYLRSRKFKILDVFNRTERGENQLIPRDEFITALKLVGVPLNNKEIEDLVIYFSSLVRQNAITTEILSSTFKQWSLTQQRSKLPTAKEYYMMAKLRAAAKTPPVKLKGDSAPQPPKMDLLTVPEIDYTEMRPMTLEEMEDVGKRYREMRRRQYKLSFPTIQFMECCRLVRSGNKHFDEHCLPSTVAGDTGELINEARRDAFLVYLRCWDLCEAYRLPLTEDILMRALLYPGDKLILLNDQVRPIRQPGGYYGDNMLVPNMTTYRTASKKFKKMHFKDFEEFTGKLKAKKLDGLHLTHPNNFWPGHLLEKLRLYLPTVNKDRSLALFSCVQPESPIYSATHRSGHLWPVRDGHSLYLL